MNIQKMLNMLMQKISLADKIFYMEQRTYKDGKVYKNYKVKIKDKTYEFNSQKDILLWLKDWK
jgi:hypothetical protein